MPKPPTPTTRADLETLLGQEESQQLEFKSLEALTNQKWKSEIAKDVSAMANATGGVIIYGLKEKEGVASEIDAGLPHTPLTADSINRVLNANIQPPIQGVEVRRITLGEGLYGYTVEVPTPGAEAPYQVPERGCYYQRQGREIRMLLDFQIRAIMNRRTRPELEVRFALGGTQHSPLVHGFQVLIFNASSEPALYTSFDILTDVELNIHESHPTNPNPQRYEARDTNNHRFVLNNFSGSLMVPEYEPIYKEKAFHLFFGLRELQPNKLYALAYQIATPGYSRRETGHIAMYGNKPELTMGDGFIKVPTWEGEGGTLIDGVMT